MVAYSGRSVKLVIPDVSGMTCKQAAHAYLDAGLWPIPWEPVQRKGKWLKRPCYRKGWTYATVDRETHQSINKWRSRWQVGLITSRRSGILAGDIDHPDEFDEWDIDDPPDTAQSATGREGGYHLVYDGRRLSDADWPVQGDIPGGQVKSNGFIGVEPSIHPSGRMYQWAEGSRELAPAGEFGKVLADYARYSRKRTRLKTSDARKVDSEDSGDLWADVIEAGDGYQRRAIFDWSVYCHDRGMTNTEIINLLWLAAIEGELRSWRPDDEWTRDGIRSAAIPTGGWKHTVHLLGSDELRDLAAIQVMEPKLAGGEGEDWFWSSREELTLIRQWAQAQLVSPWALLGEMLTEVIARVPPTFVLPDIVSGYGSLNMLLAITGESSAGKGGAAAIAEQALYIDEPKREPGAVDTGLGDDIDFMVPERWGVGSGEGLVKSYAYRTKSEGQVRTKYTTIMSISEVKSLKAIVSRGSETLTSELSKFYMGELLGFGYGDDTKRLRLPRYSYRGVLIVHAQPEQSDIIVRDDGSGFSRRWLLLDAIDRYPPDSRPPKPEPVKWSLPSSLANLDFRAERPLLIADVCDTAVNEITETRDLAYRGKSKDGTRGHILFTQEKFAMALAILAMRIDINDEDWRLAAYATERSDGLRSMCLASLRRQSYREARAVGRIDGVRLHATEEGRASEADRKFWQLIMKHIPAKGRISRGKLGSKMPQRRAELKDALPQMVKAGILETESGKYQNQEGDWYWRKGTG